MEQRWSARAITRGHTPVTAGLGSMDYRLILRHTQNAAVVVAQPNQNARRRHRNSSVDRHQIDRRWSLCTMPLWLTLSASFSAERMREDEALGSRLVLELNNKKKPASRFPGGGLRQRISFAARVYKRVL